jgi:hypothetical protein
MTHLAEPNHFRALTVKGNIFCKTVKVNLDFTRSPRSYKQLTIADIYIYMKKNLLPPHDRIL